MEVLKNRIYRHFKGDHYLVVDIARHSESGEEYVIYRQLYGPGELWIRPLKMFCETLADGQPRFSLMTVESKVKHEK